MFKSLPIWFCTLFFLVAGTAIGQLRQRTEIGGGIGTLNYTGDIVRTYNVRFSKPAVTLIYRYNFNHVVSLRTGLIIGSVGASDLKDPLDAAAKLRKASFNQSLIEIAPVFEYHFLDWKDAKRRIRYTPYLFAGTGFFMISGEGKRARDSYSNVQLSIPFGGGFKYILNPHWYAGFEIGIRKTFFDYLDNVTQRSRPTQKTFDFGNPFDNDNYFFVGLTLTRTFYEIPCATTPY